MTSDDFLDLWCTSKAFSRVFIGLFDDLLKMFSTSQAGGTDPCARLDTSLGGFCWRKDLVWYGDEVALYGIKCVDVSFLVRCRGGQCFRVCDFVLGCGRVRIKPTKQAVLQQVRL